MNFELNQLRLQVSIFYLSKDSTVGENVGVRSETRRDTLWPGR